MQDELYPRPGILQIHEQIPGLLDHPRLDWVLGGSKDAYPAGAVLYKLARTSQAVRKGIGVHELLLPRSAGPTALPAGRSAALPGGQEVRIMSGLARHEPRGQAPDVSGQLKPASEAPIVPFWPHWRNVRGLIQVEEYREDGTLVIRAELPGIDPGKDVELTFSHGMLHIEAERREEEKREGKGYQRRELRYGPLSRSLRLPEGVTGNGITATY